jgi:hypothetical protein
VFTDSAGDSTDLGSQASLPIIHAYIALQLIGGVGFAIILFTALLSRGVKRSPTWISFCASWVYSCFSYTLLSFFGQQTGKNLDHALCVIQAALIYADPALYVINIARSDLLWHSIPQNLFHHSRTRYPCLLPPPTHPNCTDLTPQMWFTVRFLLAKEPLVTGFITTIVVSSSKHFSAYMPFPTLSFFVAPRRSIFNLAGNLCGGVGGKYTHT